MKQYIVPALVLVLCASLLVGCGCTGNVGVVTDPTTQATSATTTVPTTQPTTQSTTAPTSQPTTWPTTAPDTSPTDSTGILDDIVGTDATNGADHDTIPDNGIGGMDSRRIR